LNAIRRPSPSRSNVRKDVSSIEFREQYDTFLIIGVSARNMPHLPYNLSASESCVAVIARTDPNEQESVVLMPELDGIHL